VVTASSRVKAMFFSPASSRTMLNRDKSQTWSAPLRLFAYTDLNSLCYNSFTGYGQMLRVVGLAGTGWGVTSL
jgi:hypothetical protein